MLGYSHIKKINPNLFILNWLGFFVSLYFPRKYGLAIKIGVINPKDMRKIQKFSEIEPTLGFTEFDFYQNFRLSFPDSELGKLRSLLPIEELAQTIGLKSRHLGRNAYFSAEGKTALMFLKSYMGLSDEQLIENLNFNPHLQLFCDIRIHPLYPLRNYKIVSAIRCEIAELLQIDSAQQVLASHWKPYLENRSVLLTDATCYESFIRYPTDVKLLWECVQWIYRQLKSAVKQLKIRMPRSKYDKQRKNYATYSKQRRGKPSKTRVFKRSLLHLLDKLIGELQAVVVHHQDRLQMPHTFDKRLLIIQQVLEQQNARFHGEQVTDVIVSIDKAYIRPIVRGKETKGVEFGAKVNTIQVDGINFIEHLSFDAFHEGVRLPQCIDKQQCLFGKRITHVSADRIYATNYNRSYCTEKEITTSFVRKGSASKNEQQREQMRKHLNRERSTRLEGSFGTEKQHYSLAKIKARTEPTEILWIFFGIHTANAVRMIPKIERAKQKQTA